MLFCHSNCIFLKFRALSFFDRHLNFDTLVASFPQCRFASSLLFAKDFFLATTLSALDFSVDKSEYDKCQKQECNSCKRIQNSLSCILFSKITFIFSIKFFLMVNCNISNRNVFFIRINSLYNQILCTCKVFFRNRGIFTLNLLIFVDNNIAFFIVFL